METIWKILILAGLVSIVIFLQVLACFAFGNNWCSPPARAPAPEASAHLGARRRMPLIILVPMMMPQKPRPSPRLLLPRRRSNHLIIVILLWQPLSPPPAASVLLLPLSPSWPRLLPPQQSSLTGIATGTSAGSGFLQPATMGETSRSSPCLGKLVGSLQRRVAEDLQSSRQRGSVPLPSEGTS